MCILTQRRQVRTNLHGCLGGKRNRFSLKFAASPVWVLLSASMADFWECLFRRRLTS